MISTLCPVAWPVRDSPHSQLIYYFISSFSHPPPCSSNHPCTYPVNICPSSHKTNQLTIYTHRPLASHHTHSSSIHPSIQPSLHPSIYPFIHPSIHPGVLQSMGSQRVGHD